MTHPLRTHNIPAMPTLYSQELAPALSNVQASYKQALARLQPEIQRLRVQPKPQEHAIFSLAGKIVDLAELKRISSEWKVRYKHLVVVGCGGSGLSGKALAKLKPATHTLHTLDNLSVQALPELFAAAPVQECCFFFVSKSGGTAETHAYMDLILAELAAHGLTDSLPQRALALCIEQPNRLRGLAEQHGIPCLTHDPDLGGRFSILSAVGLLPAMFMGLDAQALRRGAQAGLEMMNEAAQAAAMHYALLERGHPVHVLFTYSERLWGLARWWRQAWAESLGKDGKGSTPHISLGPNDQHSQLQLYLDGPRDKGLTLWMEESAGQGGRISEACPSAGLRGKTIGDMLAAMQRATAETLINKGCPVRTLSFPMVNEEAAGALVMQMTLEIILTAYLLGLNPFDQPAVEDSKQLTRQYLQS